MRYLRTLPTSRLLAVLGLSLALCVAAAAGAVVASGGGGETPPPKPLAEALHDSLAGPPVDGVTARVTFTNKLFPSGALLGSAGPGADVGRLGAAVADERRARADRAAVEPRRRADRLEPDRGDRLRRLLQHRLQGDPAAGGVERRGGEGHAADAGGDHRSADEGRRPRRAVRGDTDERRRDARLHRRSLAEARRRAARGGGGLLGCLARRAAASRDLRPGLLLTRARADHERHLLRRRRRVLRRRRPAREREGRRSRAAVAREGRRCNRQRNARDRSGSGAGRRRLPHQRARHSLVGLPRQDVRLVGDAESQTVVVSYGQGLGGIVVAERKAPIASGDSASGALGGLPAVSLDGVTAHELATQLGTIVTWQHADVSTTLAGSIPSAAAEAAARELR